MTTNEIVMASIPLIGGLIFWAVFKRMSDNQDNITKLFEKLNDMQREHYECSSNHATLLQGKLSRESFSNAISRIEKDYEEKLDFQKQLTVERKRTRDAEVLSLRESISRNEKDFKSELKKLEEDHKSEVQKLEEKIDVLMKLMQEIKLQLAQNNAQNITQTIKREIYNGN